MNVAGCLLVVLSLLLPSFADAAYSDMASVATTRALAEATCPCDGFTRHGKYVRCVVGVAKAAVASGALARGRQGAVIKCAARSRCGRPGWTPCFVSTRARRAAVSNAPGSVAPRAEAR